MSKIIQSRTASPWFCNFEPFAESLENDAEFQKQLRRVFDEGLSSHGKGLVVCDESHGRMAYVPIDEFLENAADCQAKRSTKRLIDSCNPDQQVTVAAMLDNGTETATYSYQAFLINVSREVQS